MKRIFLILSLLFATVSPLFAQDEDDNEGGEKIRDKMNEYIQKRLDLSKEEAEKFTPVFLRYFHDWRQTIRENRGDMLLMQQRIAELRLRYRNEFRDIVGEKRSNQVFIHQEVFIRTLKDLRKERLRNGPPVRRPPLRNNRVNRLL
jgi:hypothetical protein